MNRRRRTVVLLDTQAVWKRLDLLGRSQNWLAREVGISPGYLSTLINRDVPRQGASGGGCWKS